MGHAALAAAVAVPRYRTPNFPHGINALKKKNFNKFFCKWVNTCSKFYEVDYLFILFIQIQTHQDYILNEKIFVAQKIFGGVGYLLLSGRLTVTVVCKIFGGCCVQLAFSRCGPAL